MILTEYDRKVIAFLEEFGAASTSQLRQLFYTNEGVRPESAVLQAQRRLKLLHDNKYIKRDRGNLNTEYIYYPVNKKARNINHQKILVDVYLGLLGLPGKLEEFTPSVVMGSVIPDAKAVILVKKDKDTTLKHTFLVEIHLATNAFNQEKYEKFYQSREYKSYLDYFPKILVVSDRKVRFQESKIPYIQVPLSLEGLGDIIKEG